MVVVNRGGKTCACSVGDHLPLAYRLSLFSVIINISLYSVLESGGAKRERNMLEEKEKEDEGREGSEGK